MCVACGVVGNTAAQVSSTFPPSQTGLAVSQLAQECEAGLFGVQITVSRNNIFSCWNMTVCTLFLKAGVASDRSKRLGMNVLLQTLFPEA